MADEEQGERAEVEIREATAMDGLAVARIQIETWRASYAGLLPKEYLIDLSLEERGAWWREVIGRKREGHTLVAQLPGGGPIVGFGSCGAPRRKQPPPQRPGQAAGQRQGEVYTLYVDLDWQNRGIGRQLLGRLFEELVAQGCTSAVIQVLAANPSRYFYEAMGGAQVAEGHDYFAGAKLEILAYGWRDLQEWLAQTKRRD